MNMSEKAFLWRYIKIHLKSEVSVTTWLSSKAAVFSAKLIAKARNIFTSGLQKHNVSITKNTIDHLFAFLITIGSLSLPYLKTPQGRECL